MQLVWYSGKYWYCDYYNQLKNDSDKIELISMLDSSLGCTVFKSGMFFHLCTDPRQYKSVKYFQSIGKCWFCKLTLIKEVELKFNSFENVTYR